MEGRLPTRYRVAVWVAGLIGFGVGGGWLAYRMPRISDALGAALIGAGLGLVLGAVVVTAFLHLLESPRRERRLRPS